MATKVTMPKLSDTMTEGVLLKWLKKEGEIIQAGEVIAEAESDKATMELEAFDAGQLKKILIPEGGKVPVGGTLAIIAEEDEDISDMLNETPEAPKKETAPTPKSEKAEPLPIPAAPIKDDTPKDQIMTTGSMRIKASPLARKIAEDRKIDLKTVKGSGTGGRIIKRDIDDIKETLSTGTIIEGQDQEVQLSTMRKVIAQRMTQSKTTVPHFYLTMEIDMDKAVSARLSMNSIQSETKISHNDMVIKACAQALKKHPLVNGSFVDEKIVLHQRIDIGFAVALEEGLITPVIRNADSKSLGEISNTVKDMAKRAKNRKLMPDEYTNATFTISNLGMYDISEFSAIVNPPEAAILAVGAVQQKPVVKNDAIVIGNVMKVTLSCDHRIVDGATGALFLRELKKLLENPIAMVL